MKTHFFKITDISHLFRFFFIDKGSKKIKNICDFEKKRSQFLFVFDRAKVFYSIWKDGPSGIWIQDLVLI